MTVFEMLRPGALAALVAFAVTPVVLRLATWAGAIDQPEARKVHNHPTPRMGGLAIIAAVAAVMALPYFGVEPPFWQSTGILPPIALGLLPILFVSIWDDLRPLPPLPRLFAQVAGASMAVALGLRLDVTVHVFGVAWHIGSLSFPLSVLWIVGVTNAFNIIDGLDGLSAGLALIAASTLAAIFGISGQPILAAAAIVLAGALLGFLPYNLHPARIFLGDCGSTAIGFFVACIALKGTSTISAGFAILIPVMIVGVPIAESVLSIARRSLGSGSVFSPDRDHMHHRLLALGITHRRAVFILYGAGMAIAGVALASMLVSQRDAALLLIGVLAAGLVGVARLGYEEFAVIRNGVILQFYEAPVLRRSMFVVLVDLTLMTLSVWGAHGLRFDDWLLRPHRVSFLQMVAVLTPSTVGVFSYLKMYRGAWRVAGVEEFARAAGAVLLSSVLAYALGLLVLRSGDAATFVVYMLLMLALVLASRGSHQILSRYHHRASTEGEPVLIYGTGSSGLAALRELTHNPACGMRPIGFVDDNPLMLGRMVAGCPVIANSQTLEALLLSGSVQALILADEFLKADEAQQAEAICRRMSVRVLRFQSSFVPVPGSPALDRLPEEVALG